jgi:type I site-specific restriction endonuclease
VNDKKKINQKMCRQRLQDVQWKRWILFGKNHEHAEKIRAVNEKYLKRVKE